MRILVTNDDGIHAPGLWSLARGLKELGEIAVVAPDRDQSGIGAALTLMAVVRAREVAPHVEGILTFAVEGTPGDCVVLATEKLFSKPFDLVVSGINHGANLGLDILNSGTVGGAFHGYFRKISSIAVSILAPFSDAHYELAAQTTKALVTTISGDSLPAPLLLNVNLPNTALDKIEQVELTRLGPKAYLEGVEQGSDGRRTHYWIRHNRPVNGPIEEGTDVWAVRSNRISITPLDMTSNNHSPSPAFYALAEAVSAAIKRGGCPSPLS